MSANKSKKPFNFKKYIADPKNKAKVIKILSVVLVVSVLCAGLLIVKRTFLDSNISWTLTEKGVLTVSGSGAIKDFDPLDPDEWLKLTGGDEVKQIIIREGITEIGDYAFYKCDKATKIVLPKSLKVVGDFAFMGCTKIEGFDFKSGLNSIGKGAFYGCTGAKSFNLPKGVTHIGYDAFYGTGYYKENGNWKDGALYHGNYLLEVKDDAEGEFKAKDGTTLVADYAFSQSDKLVKVTLPGETVNVGAYAFNGCTALKQVVFEGKINAFSEGLFWNCTALEKISGSYVYANSVALEKKAGKYWCHDAGTAHKPTGDRYFSYTKD